MFSQRSVAVNVTSPAVTGPKTVRSSETTLSRMAIAFSRVEIANPSSVS